NQGWTRIATIPTRAYDVPARSGAVGVGERGKGGLRLPRHVRVRDAATSLQHRDYAVAGHVEVVAGVRAVRQVAARERGHEGAVDPLGVEDVEHLAQVGGLFRLVADVFAVETHRSGAVPFHDLAATTAPVGRAAVPAAAEL